MIEKSKIELITIAIIGSIVLIIVAGTIFTTKSASLFKNARTSTRISHMQTILGAVYMYSIDNQGAFPSCIPAEGFVDVAECTELIPYLRQGQFPLDPEPKAKYMIEYFFKVESKIRIFSTAPEAKGVELIR